MFKQNFWKKTVSEITLLAFSFAVLIPTQAHAGFYRNEMKDSAAHYSTARSHRNDGGLEAFLDAYRDDVPSMSLRFIAEHMSTDPLPKVELKNSAFHISAQGLKEDVKVKVTDLDNREFRINGLAFKWNESQSFEDNVQRILPLVNAQGFGFQNIWEVLVPSVYAEDAEIEVTDAAVDSASDSSDHSTGTTEEAPKKKGWSTTTKALVALAVAVVVGLLIWYLIKRSNDKKKEEENKSAAEKKAKEEKESINSDYNSIKNKVRQASDDNYKACGAEWVHLKDVYNESDSKEVRTEKLNTAYTTQQTACTGNESSEGATHN